MPARKLNTPEVNKLIDLALIEDIKDGDITTDAIIGDESRACARIIIKEEGVIAGLPIAEKIFKKLDSNLEWGTSTTEGKNLKKGSEVIRFCGSYRAILTGERTALNFMQRMSGIATLTRKYVSEIAGTNTKILDTRKTVPGHRWLDKYAVYIGGGKNHRFGLFDMVMIKDNHIRIAGGIRNAVESVRKNLRDNIKIEIETSNLSEVKDALEVQADILMLDNMDIPTMKEAIKIIDKRCRIEASGNMTIERIREVAELGVDFISIGALTHSVSAIDLSLEIME